MVTDRIVANILAMMLTKMITGGRRKPEKSRMEGLGGILMSTALDQRENHDRIAALGKPKKNPVPAENSPSFS